MQSAVSYNHENNRQCIWLCGLALVNFLRTAANESSAPGTRTSTFERLGLSPQARCTAILLSMVITLTADSFSGRRNDESPPLTIYRLTMLFRRPPSTDSALPANARTARCRIARPFGRKHPSFHRAIVREIDLAGSPSGSTVLRSRGAFDLLSETIPFRADGGVCSVSMTSVSDPRKSWRFLGVLPLVGGG